MPRNATFRIIVVMIASGGLLASSQSLSNESLPNLFPFPNARGLLETYNTANQPIDLTGPFFQSLGTNGRSCGSCHRPAQAWSLSPHELQLRFEQTQGRDPIFRTNDASNCDHDIDTSTIEGRRKAYSLLLNKGLIRVALAPPETAEFDIVNVVNPYGCGDPVTLSVYRRPLPATNLRFLSTVMWDGRESSPQTGTQKITFETNPNDLKSDLSHQALDAANGHAQGSTPLTAEQQQAIVDFEMSLLTAQVYDNRAGWLTANNAAGGPVHLAKDTLPPSLWVSMIH